MTQIKKTITAGGVVLNPDGQVLVVSQHGTSWSLPKGHIDEGEDNLQAAKREIYEESGVTELEYIRELGVYERYKIGLEAEEDKSELKTIYMYLFKTPQIDLKPIDPENPEALWVDKDIVGELLTHAKDQEFYLSVVDSL